MNFTSLFTNSIKTGSQLINYQTIRRRKPKKPFWLGIAKSKRFIVPEPKVLPPEEKAESTILRRNYNIQLTSLLNFIQKENPKLKDELSQADEEGKLTYTLAFEAEMSKSFENNAVWNAESARLRDERVKKEKEKFMEEALKVMKMEDDKKKKEMELIEEVVRKEKVFSASYITPENIDEAIEKCLNNIEVFDFAIDLQGNKYPGSTSLPPQIHQQKVETSENPTV